MDYYFNALLDNVDAHRKELKQDASLQGKLALCLYYTCKFTLLVTFTKNFTVSAYFIVLLHVIHAFDFFLFLRASLVFRMHVIITVFTTIAAL